MRSATTRTVDCVLRARAHSKLRLPRKPGPGGALSSLTRLEELVCHRGRLDSPMLAALSRLTTLRVLSCAAFNNKALEALVRF